MNGLSAGDIPALPIRSYIESGAHVHRSRWPRHLAFCRIERNRRTPFLNVPQSQFHRLRLRLTTLLSRPAINWMLPVWLGLLANTHSLEARCESPTGASAPAPLTTISIGATVQHSGVKRFGINLGEHNFYDSGQILKNLVNRNPGFEGEIWQSIVRCKLATSISCVVPDPNCKWPANFMAGATYEVISGKATGGIGTISGNGDANPATQIGPALFFSGHAPAGLTAGDFLVVRKRFAGDAQAGWWTGSKGGATFATEFKDLSPETPGKQALRISASEKGQSANVAAFFDSSQGHTFLQLKGDYSLTFRAKRVAGSGQLKVSLTRLIPTGNEILTNAEISLEPQWKDYRVRFHAAENGSMVGTVALNFSISEGSLLMDDVSLTPSAAPAWNPTVYRDEVVETLRTLRPGILRYGDGGLEIGSSFDNMIAPAGARQRSGWNLESVESEEVPMGLQEFLELCKAVQAEPWYIVQAGISVTEAKNLIEYLAGDARTPYGTKRAALGQREPWTTEFQTIHLELGNEEWNCDFPGECMPDPAAYARRASAIFNVMRSSRSYAGSKFDLIMGTQAVNLYSTKQELANGSGFDSLSVAPYFFNSLNESGSTEEIFGPMLAEPEMVDSRPKGYMMEQSAGLAQSGKAGKLEVYEVNLGTTTGTAAQDVLDQSTASMGAGLAVIDHMLLMLRDLGITTQNLFSLPGFTFGFSNTSAPGNRETVPLWGSVVDMGASNRKRPQFLALELANQAMLPVMLATTIAGKNPVWQQPLSRNDSISLSDAHELQVFAFGEGYRRSLIILNLSRNHPARVAFAGPNAPYGNVHIAVLSSASIRDTNESNENVVPVLSEAAHFSSSIPYMLKPFSMTTLQWTQRESNPTISIRSVPAHVNANN
jgi:hypothetical protein